MAKTMNVEHSQNFINYWYVLSYYLPNTSNNLIVLNNRVDGFTCPLAHFQHFRTAQPLHHKQKQFTTWSVNDT